MMIFSLVSMAAAWCAAASRGATMATGKDTASNTPGCRHRAGTGGRLGHEAHKRGWQRGVTQRWDGKGGSEAGCTTLAQSVKLAGWCVSTSAVGYEPIWRQRWTPRNEKSTKHGPRLGERSADGLRQ